jgi:DNA-directed RNA polymerase subunit RPC12/RpoP
MQKSEKVKHEIKFFESPVYNDILEKLCLFCGGEKTTSVILDEKKHLLTQCASCSGIHSIWFCNNCQSTFSDGRNDIKVILDTKEHGLDCTYCGKISVNE